MQLTEQQNTIIHHNGNARVRAKAGTAKTTTLIEYAKNRPKQRILYIVYNRTAKIDAVKKVHAAHLSNVRVETAHSLAFAEMDIKNKYAIHKNGSCKSYEIVEMFNLKRHSAGNKHLDLVMAKHISDCLNYYCNSSATKIEDVNYLDIIEDTNAKSFVKTNIDNIYKAVQIIMEQMRDGKIDMAHDVYLKLWQMSKTKLEYNTILIDEAQDTSNVMLSAFLDQEHATRIVVGDEHQQIYTFRHAINSLEKVDYQELYLTKSFRFTQEIAELATKSIQLKKLLGINVDDVVLTGLGGRSENACENCFLARTNIALLDAAIEHVFEKNNTNIHFEGGIRSYFYMNTGGGIYDILNLFQEKHEHIKDPLISSFKSITELEDYQEFANDHEIKLITNMVKKYRGSISYYLTKMKEYEVTKEKAEHIFSTVHKAKGMEYNHVTLCNDFITKPKIEEILNASEDMVDNIDIRKLIDEINILYVALTRGRGTVTTEPFA